MKDLVTRMQAQLKALAQKYPAAAEELGMNFELNAGAREADFAKLEQTLGYALPSKPMILLLSSKVFNCYC